MDTLIESLQELFRRDLNRLQKEIVSYPDESILWRIETDINNSAGNLTLHLCGNLQYFIGNILGNSGYIRDRENEFSAKDIARKILLADVEETRQIVKTTLSGLTESELKKSYPEQVFGYEMTMAFFLIHLSGHLNYHLGQINYHRRLAG